MDTDYFMLPNSEQQSDILEADKMLSIIAANHIVA
jgi:citrate lyase beta subunit